MLIYRPFTDEGRLKVLLRLGTTEQKLFAGSNLADDKWHTVQYQRRGLVLSLGVDGDKPALSEHLKKGDEKWRKE